MIFEAIAAIKIANEAIGAVKELCGHIQSVGQMGPQLNQLADAKEQIQKKAADGDMEAFFALEDINRKEAEIKQMFIYQGRPGLWEDYQKFMENRKKIRESARKREEAKRLAKRKAIKTGVTILAVSLSVFTAIGLGIFMVYWLISLRGK